jgi:hypothetical protein
VYRRFSEFAALNHQLSISEPADLLFAAFPLTPAKCKLGIALDETELSVRLVTSNLREIVNLFIVLTEPGSLILG